MRVLVLIPTTAGPVVITSLARRSNLPTSLVVAEGDYRPLSISADYDHLIGPKGPIARGMSPGSPSAFELRLSAAIESGKSWEVPVCIAHHLHSRGIRLTADSNEADLVIWATGAVDLDLNINPDRYFIAEKLEKCANILDDVQENTRILVLIPSSCGDLAEQAMPNWLDDARVSVVRVNSVPEALAAIPDRASKPDGAENPAQSSKTPRSKNTRRAIFVSGVGVLLLIGIIGSITASDFEGTALGWWRDLTDRQTQSNSDRQSPGGANVDQSTESRVTTQATQPASQNDEQSEPPGSAAKVSLAEGRIEPGVVADTKQAARDPLIDRMLVVHEIRPPAGETCLGVIFGGAQPRLVPVKIQNGALVGSNIEGLCGLSVRLVKQSQPYRLQVPSALASIAAQVTTEFASKEPAGITGFEVTLKRNPLPVAYSIELTPTGERSVSSQFAIKHRFFK